MKNILIVFALAFGFNMNAQFDSTTMDLNNLEIRIAPFPENSNAIKNTYSHNIRNQITNKNLTGKASSAIFSQSLWISSVFEKNEFKIAAHTYGQEGLDFRLGPLNDTNSGFDSLRLNTYNKVWGISRREIYDFLNNGTITDNIKNWPAGKNRSVKIGNESDEMAPFVDVNKDGLYEPKKGDYPLMRGDQMYWWVFNDMRIHEVSNSDPIGFEVHASAYVFYCDTLSSNNKYAYLNSSVFYNYKLLYKGEDSIKENRIGLYVDFDNGENFVDDVLAYDSISSTVYASNALSSSMKNSNNALIAVKILEDPSKVNSFMTYSNTADPINGSPRTAHDFYNYINGDFRTGFNQGSKFALPMSRLLDTSLKGNDIRVVVGMKPEKVTKGYVGELNYAIVYELEKLNTNFPKNTLSRMEKSISSLKSFDPKASIPICNSFPLSIKESSVSEQNLILFPNPNSGNFTIKWEMDKEKVKNMSIQNTIGKVIYSQEEIGNSNLIEVKKIDLPSGLYFVKINTDKGIITKKIIVR